MTTTPELFDSGLPRRQTDVLADLFTTAGERLKRMVLHPTGRTQGAREFRAGRAAQLNAQVDRVLADLGRHTAAWVGQAVPAAFTAGIQRADQQARDAGVRVEGRGPVGSFALIDRRAVEVFAHDITADLNRAAESMADRAVRLLRDTAQRGLSEQDINTILAGGVIQGQPVQAIRELRESLRAVHGNRVRILDKNGDPMEFRVGYYAQLVARTRTREATVHARHSRLKDLGLDLVAIVGRISRNFCSAFLGQVFSLSGKHGKYPAYSSLPGGGPPFHPQCSKSTRPFVEELAGEKQKEDAEGNDDAQQLLNTEPADAQRRYRDLQLYQQVRQDYATTEKRLFG